MELIILHGIRAPHIWFIFKLRVLCKFYEELRIIVLLLQLQNGELNFLDTKDPRTLQLHGLEGRYADCVAQQGSI